MHARGGDDVHRVGVEDARRSHSVPHLGDQHDDDHHEEEDGDNGDGDDDSDHQEEDGDEKEDNEMKTMTKTNDWSSTRISLVITVCHYGDKKVFQLLKITMARVV